MSPQRPLCYRHLRGVRPTWIFFSRIAFFRLLRKFTTSRITPSCSLSFLFGQLLANHYFKTSAGSPNCSSLDSCNFFSRISHYIFLRVSYVSQRLISNVNNNSRFFHCVILIVMLSSSSFTRNHFGINFFLILSISLTFVETFCAKLKAKTESLGRW